MKTIHPKCNHCGEELTINLPIVDRLNERIRYLENRVAELENRQYKSDTSNGGMHDFSNMFGDIFNKK